MEIPVSWDAEITRLIPNKLVAWKSSRGAMIQNAGRVRFFEGQGDEQGKTKIEFDFAYNPPGGALGHAIAKMLGSDPKSRIDDCFMQLKQMIEQSSLRKQIQAS